MPLWHFGSQVEVVRRKGGIKMDLEKMDFYVEEESKLTKEDAFESECIINRIGLTGEFLHKHLAYKENDDIILKLDVEDLGNILRILIMENSHSPNFKILYEGQEEYADVATDGVDCLIVGVERRVEVLRIKGMNYLFW